MCKALRDRGRARSDASVRCRQTLARMFVNGWVVKASAEQIRRRSNRAPVPQLEIEKHANGDATPKVERETGIVDLAGWIQRGGGDVYECVD